MDLIWFICVFKGLSVQCIFRSESELFKKLMSGVKELCSHNSIPYRNDNT